MATKIKSSISEVGQVLTTEEDGTLIPSRGNMNILDTPDKQIFENVVLENTPEDNLGIEVLPDGSLYVEPFSYPVGLGEPPPLSEFTMSNKVGVVFDRGTDADDTKRLQFYYDHTPDNERIHMFHPTGTYWTMRPDGSMVSKIKNNSLDIIEGHGETIIGGGYTLNVKGERLTISTNGDANISSSFDLTLSPAGSLYAFADGDYLYSCKNHFGTISGNATIEVDQNYFIDSKGVIGLKAKGGLILEAPEITYNIGKQTIDIQGTYEENTLGARIISADSVNISGQDGVNVFSAGDMEYTITGNKVINVYGTSEIPSTEAYTINVNLGNYSVITTAGVISLGTGLLGKFSGLELTPTGTATLTALIQAVIDAKFVYLGGDSASEPVVLGQSFFDHYKNHKHPHPNGTTDVVTPAPTPTLLSKQVFIAG